jgi:hypothetical protein
MCNADVGLHTSFWVEGRVLPKPDFAAMKKCRDFDKILEWGNERRVVITKMPTPAPGERVWSPGERP